MNSLPSTISVPLPKHLSPGLIARLARDVVMELRALPDILEPYCVSELQFARIKEMPFFKRVYEDFLIEWNRVTSTPERIRLISAVMLEEGLPRMGAQMVDKEVSPAIAIETGKFFAKIAGVGEAKTDANTGEKFVINISLGEDTKLQFTKDVTPRTPTDAVEAIFGEVPEDRKRDLEPPKPTSEISEQPAGKSTSECMVTDTRRDSLHDADNPQPPIHSKTAAG